MSAMEQILIGLADKKQVIGPIESGGSKRYFEAVPVKDKIERLTTNSGIKLYSEFDLIKKCKGYDKYQVGDAIRELVAESAIIKLKCGKGSSTYVLHRTVAAEYLRFPETGKTRDDAAPTINAELVRPVYERIKSEQRGIETVLIYDLIKALNVSKEDLHSFIRQEAKADRASFHTAAAATLSREALDAGIRLEGESHPYVSVVFRSDL